jgi:hypothetical protein
MVNRNDYGLRSVALRSFSELINHCRNTSVVTEEIKKTRKGLQRISLDYVQGLSKMYCVDPKEAEKGNTLVLSENEKAQVLQTLQDFSSIAKSGTLSNRFLTAFAELVTEKEANAVDTDAALRRLDVLIAMMEKVKLSRENQVQLMLGVKGFIDDKHT